MFTDEARFGPMNRPRPCWAPGRHPARNGLTAHSRIHLVVRCSLPERRDVRLPDHADVEYGVLPDIPRLSPKVCQAGHPVGSRWRSQPPLRENSRFPPTSRCSSCHPIRQSSIRSKTSGVKSAPTLRSIDAVRRKLEQAIHYIERNPETVKSITSFLYIVRSL